MPYNCFLPWQFWLILKIVTREKMLWEMGVYWAVGPPAFQGQNWPARPWPDQSFWQPSRLFRRVFAAKPVLRSYYLEFDWSGWRVLITNKILITTGMVWLVGPDKWNLRLKCLHGEGFPLKLTAFSVLHQPSVFSATQFCIADCYNIITDKKTSIFGHRNEINDKKPYKPYNRRVKR